MDQHSQAAGQSDPFAFLEQLEEWEEAGVQPREKSEDGVDDAFAQLEELEAAAESKMSEPLAPVPLCDAQLAAHYQREAEQSQQRAGFIAVVGRPNVGKSTLINALVGQKVAITSSRPETTRHNMRGVVNVPGVQLVLIDTPGLHRPRTLLGKRLNDMAREALTDVDAVVFCVPADQKPGPGDRFIAAELAELKVPVVLALTKIDLLSRDQVLTQLALVDQLGDWHAIVPLSAAEKNLGDLIEVVGELMPLSPPLYPLDQVSDENVETMIGELVREAALEGVRDELPHSLAVQVNEIIDPETGQNIKYGYGTYRDSEKNVATANPTGRELPPVDVHVNIFVERNSQKGIMIGKGGAHIKKVRTRAKRQIRDLLGRPVNLDLHVRVAKNWQTNTKLLNRLGF